LQTNRPDNLSAGDDRKTEPGAAVPIPPPEMSPREEDLLKEFDSRLAVTRSGLRPLLLRPVFLLTTVLLAGVGFLISLNLPGVLARWMRGPLAVVLPSIWIVVYMAIRRKSVRNTAEEVLRELLMQVDKAYAGKLKAVEGTSTLRARRVLLRYLMRLKQEASSLLKLAEDAHPKEAEQDPSSRASSAIQNLHQACDLSSVDLRVRLRESLLAGDSLRHCCEECVSEVREVLRGSLEKLPLATQSDFDAAVASDRLLRGEFPPVGFSGEVDQLASRKSFLVPRRFMQGWQVDTPVGETGLENSVYVFRAVTVPLKSAESEARGRA